MCRLKRWPPKSPWKNIHSQEPRAPKSCSIRAPIRAPKSCSIRVPDSGPEKSYGSRIRAEKSYTIQARKDGWWTQMCRLKRWPPKSPWRNIHSQEPRAPKSCSIRVPVRAPKSCSIRVPDLGPEKLFDSGPDSGPEKLFHSGPGFGPRKAVPFGPRVQALNCFQAGKTLRVGSEDLFKIWAGFRPRSCRRGSKGQWRNGSAPEPTCGPTVREVADSNPACPIFCAE